MKMFARLTALLSCAAALMSPLLSEAAAGPYPERPITIIVPFAAGGTSDAGARFFAAKLSQALNQSVIVENRAGAGTVIGTAAGIKAKPDGYTLLYHTNTISILPNTRTNLPFDVTRDLTPITTWAIGSYAVLAAPQLGASSLRDLVEYAKANPGKLNVGTAGGIGTGSHLVLELLRSTVGADWSTIHYSGGGPASIAVVRNDVQFVMDGAYGYSGLIKDGQMRLLAVTGTERSPDFPDVPTTAEAGYPNCVVSWYHGISVPNGTPADVVAKLYETIGRILQTSETQGWLASIGARGGGISPEAFRTKIQDDIAMWQKLILANALRFD